ncbi:MAG: hypothetical protein CVV49_02575 [Spirochaetae bacterium HGW-Spirochaetae-5]|nr:MAG: hypothetical protein CVV49_02575 [Spirochaetae bacterium HGW-Spirochaetae-5]
MKYNLGCGFTKIPNYINCDNDEVVKPDLLLDLNKNDWFHKLENAEEICAYNVIEHLHDLDNFFINAYKALNLHGKLIITVPCVFHENAFNDPSHVNYFTPKTFLFFSNNDFSHYNTKKGYKFKLVKLKLTFSKGLLGMFFYSMMRFFSTGVSLSFVSEIKAEMEKLEQL